MIEIILILAAVIVVILFFTRKSEETENFRQSDPNWCWSTNTGGGAHNCLNDQVCAACPTVCQMERSSAQCAQRRSVPRQTVQQQQQQAAATTAAPRRVLNSQYFNDDVNTNCAWRMQNYNCWSERREPCEKSCIAAGKEPTGALLEEKERLQQQRREVESRRLNRR
jgi:hypothetical protein